MIQLGCLDPNVPDTACIAYEAEVQRLTLLPLTNVKPGIDKFEKRRLVPGASAMSVLQIQQALQQCGFFPGGKGDGIFGYRTQSAVRLFQEYLRTVDGVDCTPDGIAGPRTQAELQRWQQQGLVVPVWANAIEAWRTGATPPDSEYAQWLTLLRAVKQRYLAEPSAVLKVVNAFTRPTDTQKVAQWDYDNPQIHLVGISRQQFKGLSDDIFLLLIKGLVFKFQGSTEPGATDNPGGPPFLVPGQHDYRFGWHKSTYLALRPRASGVMVVRSNRLDAPLAERWSGKPPETAGDLNIHWGGLGLKGAVNSWSLGCQIISGGLYLGADGKVVNCQKFAAVGSKDPTERADKTRGAYNVLLDLVTALGSDLPGNVVKYTLLLESDLAMAPALQQRLEADRSRVMGGVA